MDSCPQLSLRPNTPSDLGVQWPSPETEEAGVTQGFTQVFLVKPTSAIEN